MAIQEYIWLFIMSLVAATVSGTAGFGASIILLPILTSIYGFIDAIPIITIAQLFSNASRAWFGHRDIAWRPIWVFLVGAVPLAIVGAFVFAWINDNVLIMLGGLFLIFVVVFRNIFPRQRMLSSKGLLIGGGATGFFAGIVGNGAPISSALFFSLNLTATAYVASEAVAGLVLNIVTTLIYQTFSLISLMHLWVGLYLSVAMVLGSWLGRFIVVHLNYKRFLVMVEILLVLCGLLMFFAYFVNR